MVALLLIYLFFYGMAFAVYQLVKYKNKKFKEVNWSARRIRKKI